ncbi:MAG: alpha/beta hydrolase, partial [Candidatus Bipolaricaulia bacterium]
MILPEEARVATGSGELHLDIYPHGGHRPLLYLHPAGCYAGMFQEQLGRLAEAGFTVVALDLPGHGRSGRKGDFDLLQAARSILEVGEWIAKEFGERPGLLGTSLGGVIGSYALVLDDGEIFPAAVLHSPAATPEEVRRYSRFPRLFASLLKPYHWVGEHLVEPLPPGVRRLLAPLGPGRLKLPIPLFFN